MEFFFGEGETVEKMIVIGVKSENGFDVRLGN